MQSFVHPRVFLSRRRRFRDDYSRCSTLSVSQCGADGGGGGRTPAAVAVQWHQAIDGNHGDF